MLENRIEHIEVKNFRSLADVTLDLADLTVLVGPNGSGKSNLLDVFRFVSDALRLGLDAALLAHERGGIGALRRFSPKGRPYDVSITLHLTLNHKRCEYHFVLGSEKKNEYSVKHERCVVGEVAYEIRNGKVVESRTNFPAVVAERNLSLSQFAVIDEFLLLYGFLSNLAGFYSIFPDRLRLPQRPGNPFPLDSQGDNLASVVRGILRNPDSQLRSQLGEVLSRVVPGIDPDDSLSVQQVGSFLVTRIKHTDSGTFDLARESDGTIRLLGLLTAAYQRPWLGFIGIEEPEMMIHPGAMGELCDIFKEVSSRTQIVLTTHSPDLISRFDVDSLRLVDRIDGETKVSYVSDANRDAVNARLFSAGDLLRIGALQGV